MRAVCTRLGSLVTLLALAELGCSSFEVIDSQGVTGTPDAPLPVDTGGGGTGVDSGSSTAAVDTTTGSVDTSGTTASAAGSSSTGPTVCMGADGGSENQEPPIDPDALLVWLEAESYSGWSSDAMQRQGDRHEDVRVWINAAMVQGLDAGMDPMPAGAASVLEHFDDDGRIGWSVHYRFQDGPIFQSWYWYEWIDGIVTVAGDDVPRCAACHGGDGVDTVVQVCPLQ